MRDLALPFFPALFSRLLGFCFINGFGEPALLPGSGVAMDQVFPASPIKQFHGIVVGRLRRITRGGAHFLERGAELAPLLAIGGGGPLGLTHPLLG
jgi:hypothetical protein